MDFNKKNDDYNIATLLAKDKFEEKHPRVEQPIWLDNYTTITGMKTGYKNWVIKRMLFHKIQLKPNQHWGKSAKGNPLLIEVDPITGDEFVVRSGGSSADIEVIFMVEVDIMNSIVTVLIDTDLNKLDENKYQVQRI